MLVLAFASGLLTVLRGDPLRDRLARFRLGDRGTRIHFVHTQLDVDVLNIFAVSTHAIRLFCFPADRSVQAATSSKVPELCLDQHHGAPEGCVCTDADGGIAVARSAQGIDAGDTSAGSDVIRRAIGRGEV